MVEFYDSSRGQKKEEQTEQQGEIVVGDAVQIANGLRGFVIGISQAFTDDIDLGNYEFLKTRKVAILVPDEAIMSVGLTFKAQIWYANYFECTKIVW